MDIETKEIDGKKISWLSDEEYEKSVGQLRLQLNGVFKPFMFYGMSIYIPGAKDAIIKLCEDFSLRTRGLDKPIDFEIVKLQTGFRD
jgi:hypothetical protein